MPGYVAFLRAVNVSGRFVKMAELRAALESAGFLDVETHIQSGNVAVTSRRRSTARVAAELAGVLTDWAGFEVPCIVRTPAELAALVDEVDAIPPLLPGPTKRYLAIADGPVPAPAGERLDAWSTDGERARVVTGAVLAELGKGFHASTLTNARIERMTGLTTTWRDLGVVRAVAEKWSDR
ncbi:DUF1697 domain-containing protein [uncultured Phycicoccus sp.]|uniref:DUF1697 domain-containing protein n=1 Tax=uncultured Phycicoccus sp. TaxID=661422 RepID=UPI0026210736|nr:DUF1697 domain-containing protein [uncultured Phycicoccus sp.]